MSQVLGSSSTSEQTQAQASTVLGLELHFEVADRWQLISPEWVRHDLEG